MPYSVSSGIPDVNKNRIRLAPLAGMVLLALVSLSALAETGNHGEAVLHIRVNIVPTLITPSAAPTPQAGAAIAYNVPSATPNVDVIRETRSLSVSDSGVTGRLQRAEL